jgi:hypothetical protein
VLRGTAVAICYLSERASHPLKVTDLSPYVVETGAGHTVGIRARPLGMNNPTPEVDMAGTSGEREVPASSVRPNADLFKRFLSRERCDDACD